MINKAIIMGRLTRDPEVRTTNSGKSVCSFTVAVDNGYGENRQTEFINCVAWQSQADFVGRYFAKGMMIIVIGRISTRSWEGQDGRKNYTTEIIASEVSFGESKKAREANGGYAPAQQNYSQPYSAPQQQYAPQHQYAPAQQPAMPDNLDDDEFLPISEVDDDLPF